MKTCSRCDTAKAVSDFSSQPSRTDGLSSWCKPCLKVNTAKYRESSDYQAKEKAARATKLAADPVAAGRRKIQNALSNARWTARKFGAPYVPYTVDDVIREWGLPSSWVCIYCGGDADSIEHLVPLSRGGDDSLGNIGVACLRRCNTARGSRGLLDFLGDVQVPEHCGPGLRAAALNTALRVLATAAQDCRSKGHPAYEAGTGADSR